MQTNAILIVSLLCLLLGCSSAANVSPEAGADTASGLPAPGSSPTAGLPDVASLKHAAYTAADLVQDGSSFVPDVSNNIATEAAASARLTPDFAPQATPPTTELAWGTYLFTLEDYDLGAAIDCTFSEFGAADGLWLALANWELGRWSLWAYDPAAGLTLSPAQFAPYLDEAGRLALAVLAGGQADFVLEQVALSEVEAPEYPNMDAPVGVNLELISDWMRTWVFTDIMKTSRTWISQPADYSQWDDGRTVDTDEFGWVRSLDPGQVATSLILTEQLGNRDPARYVLLYEGEGSIDISRFDATEVSSEPGRIVFDHAPTAGGLTTITITATNPADYIRNIRVVPLEDEATYAAQLFTPEFLASLEPFGVLRFHDWQSTTDNPVVHWGERVTPQHRSQMHAHGACVEYMVQLCNTVGADPWFCMPHRADDDYITQFATYVRDNLDPGLRVYLEYSNEVWNGIFAQSWYAREQGLALGLSADEWEAQHRFYSRRAVEVFQLWDAVFNDPERIVNVLSGWAAMPEYNAAVLDYEDAYTHADALAVAPYYGYEMGTPEHAATVLAMSNAEVLAELDAYSEVVHNGGWDRWSGETLPGSTIENRAIADARGLGLITYEGGQHLAGNGGAEWNEDLTAKFISVNREPGMRQVYFDDYQRWHTANPGGLYVIYNHIGNYTMWGSWGLKETQMQATTEAPKWLGLMDYISWLGR